MSLKGKVKELEIENAMINRIKDVLIELGNVFAFVGNPYKLTVSNKDFSYVRLKINLQLNIL
ncbi:MAG: DUF1016 family protein [Clostridia bacterium]|nr:DUF1016 family protein [Clostridia bacterium]